MISGLKNPIPAEDRLKPHFYHWAPRGMRSMFPAVGGAGRLEVEFPGAMALSVQACRAA